MPKSMKNYNQNNATNGVEGGGVGAGHGRASGGRDFEGALIRYVT